MRTVTLAHPVNGTLALDGTVDADGNRWWPTGLAGWDDGAGAAVVSERPFQDGAYVSDGYYPARMVTVDVACEGVNQRAARTRLAAVMDLLRTDGTLTIADSPEARQATVRRANLTSTVKGTLLRAQIQLVAPDPTRYGATLKTGSASVPSTAGGFTFPATPPFAFGGPSAAGTVLATNAGNVPSPPVLTFQGPLDTPRVQNGATGQTITLDLVLAAGSAAVVNVHDRTVLVDGTANRRDTFRAGSEFFDLIPGDNPLSFSATTVESGTLTVAWRDAWR